MGLGKTFLPNNHVKIPLKKPIFVGFFNDYRR